MGKGLKLPIGPDGSGRTAIISQDAQATKLISIALSDLDNDNAFQQDIGLGSDLVFEISGSPFRAEVRRRVKEIFSEFEKNKKFKLINSSIKFSKEVPGEEVLEFQYINIESDEVVSFKKNFVSR